MSDNETPTQLQIRSVREKLGQASYAIGLADNGATDSQTLNAIEYLYSAVSKLTRIVDGLVRQAEGRQP